MYTTMKFTKEEVVDMFTWFLGDRISNSFYEKIDERDGEHIIDYKITKDGSLIFYFEVIN